MLDKNDLRKTLMHNHINYSQSDVFDGYVILAPSHLHINVFVYKNVFETQARWEIAIGHVNPHDKTQIVAESITDKCDIEFINHVFSLLKPFLK